MDINEDQVRYYGLCGKDKPLTIIDGTGKLTTDPDYMIV
jgi:CRISPR-associated protein Cas2